MMISPPKSFVSLAQLARRLGRSRSWADSYLRPELLEAGIEPVRFTRNARPVWPLEDVMDYIHKPK